MTQPVYSLHIIPNGAPGIRETLRVMSSVVKRYKVSPHVRELALKLTRDLPPKKWLSEATRIHNFVRDKIRYIKDVRGVETIQTPVQTLRIGQGDCDDKSVLIASLLESLGHPTRFVAVGFMGNGSYSHVFPQTKIGDKWITLEATEPWPIGRTPANITNKIIYHN